MENHPQWEAPCPPDLILYKEQVAEQDEQEYDAGYLGISQLVLQWRLRWHDYMFIATHLENWEIKYSLVGSRERCKCCRQGGQGDSRQWGVAMVG